MLRNAQGSPYNAQGTYIVLVKGCHISSNKHLRMNAGPIYTLGVQGLC